ncbi:AAA family ATPase [Nocardioides sp. R-C-SC26]|uniref:AAA family ATPase n=1 Tax=Nocardioides sp. R-C-SC26 TaxID=2870414 RepID=UPI001E371BFB|nr:SMC family ATPase [Nocardioides sp. R-C-SC26]
MRLHSLRIEAFGPFAGVVDIDVDELSDAGLFLLSGATGAGKTSVLDAVCFALFGDVPGDRSAAKRLRADQADDGAVPRVSIEATLGGRRFHLVRSPAWDRPKKRGTGTTPQQASVSVSEWLPHDGTWRPVTNRMDEAGDLVTRLLGMNLTQFTQVAMLPQGRFQAFLRANSHDRHQLLQRLFHTHRFEQVERWLREHALDRGRVSARHREAVLGLVSRVSEASDRPPPDGVSDGAPAPGDPAALADAVSSWAAPVSDALRAGEATAREHAQTSRRLADALGHQHHRLRDQIERQRECAAANRVLSDLDAEHDQDELDRGRLDAARRAVGVLPLHDRLRADIHQQTTTADAASEATEAAAIMLAGPDAEATLPFVSRSELEAARETSRARAAAGSAALPRLQRREVLVRERSALEHRETELETVLATLHSDAAPLPAALADVEAALADATSRAAVLVRDQEALRAAEERVAAHEAALSLTDDLAEAQAAWWESREHLMEAREQLVVLQQARIDGMAAELAGALAVGACCPVCGSAEHPHKAPGAPGAPDAAQEKAVRSRADDLALEVHAREGRLREVQAALAHARGRAGEGTLETARADHAACAGRLSSSTEAADAVVALTARRDAVREHLDTIRRRNDDAERERERLRTRREAVTDETEAIDHDLSALVTVDDTDDLDQAVRALITHDDLLRERCDHAISASDAAESAAVRAGETRRELERAAAAAGFGSPHEAIAAALDGNQIDELITRIADREHRRTSAAATLARWEAVSEDPAAQPDLATLIAQVDGVDVSVEPTDDEELLSRVGEAATRADSTATSAEAALLMATQRLARVNRLLDDLTDALEAWAPVRTEHERAAALAALVEGKSADNPLKMRLSAYVVAYRLSQVVAAANERLARMSDQRYSLEHTGRRGAGESRGGLSLLVRDDWSGESRDPATLSGGETFVVSLALALGLADVITGEVGGATLDTLFVDEGFGSLDADTLDDVMDTLDSLRDGGRVVGVVSHVAEMRDRIPVQLVVTKSRAGSTAAIRRLAAG